MLSSRNKLYEVDRIAGRRHSQGKEEFLVYWKGYDSYSATWEPSENLSFCKEIVQKFVSKILPIPGAIPCNASQLISKNKSKTVSVKMLLTRKRRRSKSILALAKPINHDESSKSQRLRKGLSETEKLIRDTLLHESKSMSPNASPLTIVNGLLGYKKDQTNKNHRHSVNGFVNSFSDNSRKVKTEPVSGSLDEPELQNCATNGTSQAPCNRAVKHSLRDAGEGDHIICQTLNNYMKVTLNNTARHNVLTTHMMDTLTQCLQAAQNDSSVRAVVLKNNGDHFCSGIDFSELIECDEKHFKSRATEICASVRSLSEALIHFPKPILSAVNGLCLGFGVAIVALSDLTFTSSKTYFELTDSKLDLTPIGCLTYLLPKLVGPAMANSMFFLGESLRATAAYDRGLINDIYGIHSFQEDIEKRINQLIARQSQAMEDTKRMLRELDLEILKKTCDSEMEAFTRCLTSEKCRRRLCQDWTVTINLYGSVQ